MTVMNVEKKVAKNMDLSKYGINNVTEIVRNPSYEVLFEEETKPGLEGYERGIVTELGAVSVDTGIFTGRSPKDKFIVKDDTTKDTLWWSDQGKNDNKSIGLEAWNDLKELVTDQLSGKRLFVIDATVAPTLILDYAFVLSQKLPGRHTS